MFGRREPAFAHSSLRKRSTKRVSWEHTDSTKGTLYKPLLKHVRKQNWQFKSNVKYSHSYKERQTSRSLVCWSWDFIGWRTKALEKVRCMRIKYTKNSEQEIAQTLVCRRAFGGNAAIFRERAKTCGMSSLEGNTAATKPHRSAWQISSCRKYNFVSSQQGIIN